MRPYLDLGDGLDLLEVVALAIAQITCEMRTFRGSAYQGTMGYAPLLWYMGSTIGPARSKTWVAGKPTWWKLCTRGHVSRHAYRYMQTTHTWWSLQQAWKSKKFSTCLG